MSHPPQKQDPSIGQGRFGLFWGVSTFVIVLKFWWVRNIALVIWVFGPNAYFHDGVRVLYGKPVRFSTGELAPQFPDMITGLGYFLIVALSWTILVNLVRGAYQRYRKNKRNSQPG